MDTGWHLCNQVSARRQRNGVIEVFRLLDSYSHDPYTWESRKLSFPYLWHAYFGLWLFRWDKMGILREIGGEGRVILPGQPLSSSTSALGVLALPYPPPGTPTEFETYTTFKPPVADFQETDDLVIQPVSAFSNTGSPVYSSFTGFRGCFATLGLDAKRLMSTTIRVHWSYGCHYQPGYGTYTWLNVGAPKSNPERFTCLFDVHLESRRRKVKLQEIGDLEMGS